MTARGLTIEFRVPRRRDNRRKRPEAPEPVPRIARLLALAHKWEGMVRRGEVESYAEIAKLMGLSRARVTQISNLALLSPRLQEQILADSQDRRPRVNPGAPQLRAVVIKPAWADQEAVVPGSFLTCFGGWAQPRARSAVPCGSVPLPLDSVRPE
jgi:hypothetical protein